MKSPIVKIMAPLVLVAAIVVSAGAVLGSIGWLIWVVMPRDQSFVQETAEFVQRALGEHPEKWRQFVYNYQTLIGGMLAILAALITVVAMIVVDQRQAARHNQLVELNVREDKLRLERLLVPQLSSFMELQKWFTEAHATLPMNVPPDGGVFDQLREDLDCVREKVVDVHMHLRAQTWRAGEDLFGGQLVNDCAQLPKHIDLHFQRIDSLDGKIVALIKADMFVSAGPTEEERTRRQEQMVRMRYHLQTEVGNLRENTTEFAAALGLVIAHLRALAREYGVILPTTHGN